MFKDEAINLLGGSAVLAAELMGVTYQAVNKWPDDLPRRISDRVLGACTRRGIDIPERFLAPAQPSATPHQPVQPAGAAHADLQGVA